MENVIELSADEILEQKREKNRQAQKKYREANIEKIREKGRQSQKKFREENKEKKKEYGREYYEKNKEILSMKAKQYYQQNKERFKEHYETNKETILKQLAEKKQQTADYFKAYYEKNKQTILARNSENQKKQSTRVDKPKTKKGADSYTKEERKIYNKNYYLNKKAKSILLPPPQWMLDEAELSPDFSADEIIPPPSEFL